MNSDILINFSKIIIVLLCLAAIIIIVWHNISKRTYPPHLLPLVIGLLILSLWSLLSTTIPTSFITITALLIILLLLYSIPKQIKPKLKQAQFDQAQLICSAQEQERSRIYANLHDDVGAKLLELIYSAQDDKTKTLAKDILAQMRQAVAQTQNIQCNLEELIASIYNEAKLRLDACDININCENHITDNNYKFTGIVPSVIERICREVISNIIKHAQATDVTIAFANQSTGFSIKISDNGIGFKANKNGKGLTTIEKRAKKIKAQTHWHSEQNKELNKGTHFTLSYHYDN